MIGDWVNSDFGIFQIKEIFDDAVRDNRGNDYEFDCIHTISLTGEILKSNGFEFVDDIYRAKALVEYTDLVEISGYAEAEALTTVQGSLAALSAAWQNWLSGLMDENADIGQLTEDVLSSVAQVVENLKPKVEEFFNNLPEAIHNALEPFPEL